MKTKTKLDNFLFIVQVHYQYGLEQHIRPQEVNIKKTHSGTAVTNQEFIVTYSTQIAGILTNKSHTRTRRKDVY